MYIYFCDPYRLVHRFGFPEEFSIVTTFRMRENTPRIVWNLWEITDRYGTEQFRLRLYGETNAVEVYIVTAVGEEITTFENVGQLFNQAWHKLSFGATRTQLTLFVDCQQVGTAPIQLYGTIAMDGFTAIVKETKSDATLPVSTYYSMTFQLLPLILHPTELRISKTNLIIIV